jgi:hypothetical protein
VSPSLGGATPKDAWKIPIHALHRQMIVL